jgi:hypothetical protein
MSCRFETGRFSFHSSSSQFKGMHCVLNRVTSTIRQLLLELCTNGGAQGRFKLDPKFDSHLFSLAYEPPSLSLAMVGATRSAQTECRRQVFPLARIRPTTRRQQGCIRHQPGRGG